eukprot:3876676-Rhodomonas_salina.1
MLVSAQQVVDESVELAEVPHHGCFGIIARGRQIHIQRNQALLDFLGHPRPDVSTPPATGPTLPLSDSWHGAALSQRDEQPHTATRVRPKHETVSDRRTWAGDRTTN